MQVNAASAGFGVSEVLGVDPGRGDEQAAELRAALAQHAVLVLRFARPQEDDELQAVARSSSISIARSRSKACPSPRGARCSSGCRITRSRTHRAANTSGGITTCWSGTTPRVQHKAGGNFKVGEPRRFWRYMVAGTRPV